MCEKFAAARAEERERAAQRIKDEYAKVAGKHGFLCIGVEEAIAAAKKGDKE